MENQTTFNHGFKEKSPGVQDSSWWNAILSFSVFIPLTVSEFFSQGAVHFGVLIIFAVALVMAFWRKWPLWSYWWSGVTVFYAGITLFGYLFQILRIPPIYSVWSLVVFWLISFISFSRGCKGDIHHLSLAILPFTFEEIHYLLFSSFNGAEMSRLQISRLVLLVLYAVMIVFYCKKRNRRTYHLIFILAVLANSIAAIALSWPIITGFTNTFTGISLLLWLLLGPSLWGLLSNPPQKSMPQRIILFIRGMLLVLLALNLGFPFFTGEVFPPNVTKTRKETSPPKIKVIIDTDLSNDDYVAILYLLQRKDIDIIGITVVNGVAHVKPGVFNIQDLLLYLGRETIPVGAGADFALTGGNSFPEDWRSLVDYGVRPCFFTSRKTPQAFAATELIRNLARQSSQPVSFIALGPLTNLARAIADDPPLINKLGQVIISGGAIAVPGVVHEEDPSRENRVSEWNLYIDPLAAESVFRSGCPLTLVPLDITHKDGPKPLLVSRNLVNRIFKQAKTRESILMAQIMNSCFILYPGQTTIPIWDLPVAAIAVNRKICSKWEALPVRMMTEPENIAGQTVIDPNITPNVTVALEGATSEFEQDLLRTVE